MAHENLKKLCEKYAEVKIVRQDSFNAGNCEDGTRGFINLHFPNRRVVRVKELVPFIDDYKHVRSVLVYKLRGLEQTEIDTDDDHPF